MQWPQKPPIGTLLNNSHPWVGAAKLLAFFPLNELTGITIRDIVHGLQLTGTGSTVSIPAWGYGGINARTTGQGWTVPLPSWLKLSWPVTLAQAFYGVSTPNANNLSFGVQYDSSGINPFLSYGFQTSGSAPSPDEVVYNSGGTLAVLGPGSAFTVPGWHVTSFLLTPTSQTLYYDGVLAATSSSSISNPTFGGSPSLNIGFDTSRLNSPETNRSYLWCAIWASAQGQQFHSAVGRNINAIWQIMKPAYLNSIFPASLITAKGLMGQTGGMERFQQDGGFAN
jgi:hypothetical protein